MEYERKGYVTTHHKQRKRMMEKRELPERGWKIWIGNLERKESAVYYAAHPFHVIHGKSTKVLGQPVDCFNGQATTQVVKNLFIHIIRSPMPSIVRLWRFEPSVAAKLRVIWPISSYSIAWPPPAMTDRDANYVATAFFAFIDRKTREALPASKA